MFGAGKHTMGGVFQLDWGERAAWMECSIYFPSFPSLLSFLSVLLVNTLCLCRIAEVQISHHLFYALLVLHFLAGHWVGVLGDLEWGNEGLVVDGWWMGEEYVPNTRVVLNVYALLCSFLSFLVALRF